MQPTSKAWEYKGKTISNLRKNNGVSSATVSSSFTNIIFIPLARETSKGPNKNLSYVHTLKPFRTCTL